MMKLNLRKKYQPAGGYSVADIVAGKNLPETTTHEVETWKQAALLIQEAGHPKPRRPATVTKALIGKTRFVPKVQERSALLASASEVDAWIAKLPKKAQRLGIIEVAEGGPEGIAVTATWESGEPNLGMLTKPAAWHEVHAYASRDPELGKQLAGWERP